MLIMQKIKKIIPPYYIIKDNHKIITWEWPIKLLMDKCNYNQI